MASNRYDNMPAKGSKNNNKDSNNNIIDATVKLDPTVDNWVVFVRPAGQE